MRKRRAFCPTALEDLEPRIALSGVAAVRPVARAKLVLAAHTDATQAVANQVNLAFDNFTTDYLQAQGAYLADNVKGSRAAFKNFVTQRVELLAAQLTRIIAHVPGSLSRLQTSSSGGPVVIQVFLKTRINGDSGSSLIRALNGSGGADSGAVPPFGLKGPITTIYTDQAISAIETARTATLNSVGFLYGKSFDKHR